MTTATDTQEIALLKRFKFLLASPLADSFRPCCTAALAELERILSGAPAPASPRDRLEGLIADGLHFAQALDAFRQHQERTEPHLTAYAEALDIPKLIRLGGSDAVDVDSGTIVSEGEGGAHLLAWLWRPASDAGVTTAQDEEDQAA